jgi:hypothetical protein
MWPIGESGGLIGILILELVRTIEIDFEILQSNISIECLANT